MRFRTSKTKLYHNAFPPESPVCWGNCVCMCCLFYEDDQLAKDDPATGVPTRNNLRLSFGCKSKMIKAGITFLIAVKERSSTFAPRWCDMPDTREAWLCGQKTVMLGTSKIMQIPSKNGKEKMRMSFQQVFVDVFVLKQTCGLCTLMCPWITFLEAVAGTQDCVSFHLLRCEAFWKQACYIRTPASSLYFIWACFELTSFGA